MISIEPVVTLTSLLTHPDADDMGLNELVDNGYKDDMDDHFVSMSTVDEGDSFEEVDELIITDVKKIDNSMWCSGRLYDEGTIVVFSVKGREGLWTTDNLQWEE